MTGDLVVTPRVFTADGPALSNPAFYAVRAPILAVVPDVAEAAAPPVDEVADVVVDVVVAQEPAAGAVKRPRRATRTVPQDD